MGPGPCGNRGFLCSCAAALFVYNFFFFIGEKCDILYCNIAQNHRTQER